MEDSDFLISDQNPREDAIKKLYSRNAPDAETTIVSSELMEKITLNNHGKICRSRAITIPPVNIVNLKLQEAPI